MTAQIRSGGAIVLVGGAEAALSAGGDSEAEEGVGLGGEADNRQVPQREVGDDGAGSVPDGGAGQ